MHPYKHAHVAVMGAFGDDEREFELATTAHLGTFGEGCCCEVLDAVEVVETIAIVVDGHTEAGRSAGVHFVEVVSHFNGKGVGGAAAHEERRNLGIAGIVIAKPEIVVAYHVGHIHVKFVIGDSSDIETFDRRGVVVVD